MLITAFVVIVASSASVSGRDVSIQPDGSSYASNIYIDIDGNEQSEPLTDELLLPSAQALSDSGKLDEPLLNTIIDHGSKDLLTRRYKVLIIPQQAIADHGFSSSLSSLNQRIRSAADSVLRTVRNQNDFELRVRFRSINVIAADAGLQSLLALAADSSVRQIGLDASGRGGLNEAIPQVNIDKIRQTYGYTGNGIEVAVLDTGIDTDHVDLQGIIASQKCFADVCPNGADNAEDDKGHGTHVSGIIASQGTASPTGAAPGVRIHAVKVLDSSGNFHTTNLLSGLDYVINDLPNVDIVNMSLGTNALFDTDCDTQYSYTRALSDAINTLRDRGVLSFVSSMNDASDNAIAAPACIANAIAVGAVYDTQPSSFYGSACDEINPVADTLTCFSNTSVSLDLVAPGSPITSTQRGGGTTIKSGTSMSTPLAAACAALIMEHNSTWSVDEIEAVLETSDVIVTDREGREFPRLDCMGFLKTQDTDGDGVIDSLDDLPLDETETIDTDGDGIGNNADAFPLNAAESTDTDTDGIGNNADTDDDGDGLSDVDEGFYGTDPLLADTDSDGVIDSLDDLPLDETETIDTDGDGIGNNADAFPLNAAESTDTDIDGIGNNADTDDDNDGVLDTADAFALISLGDLADTDGDGRPNDCDSTCQSAGMSADTDDDNDGVLDTADAFALISLGGLTDTDGDGRPNDCDSTCQTAGMSADTDDDGDNAIDSLDPWPLDKRYAQDTDSDGLPDAYETDNGLNPNDASDTITDADGDDLTVLEEFGYGTSDSNTDSDFDTLPDGWEVAVDRNLLKADYGIATRREFTCAIEDVGIRCWGNAQNNRLNPPALNKPRKVGVGWAHGCVLDETPGGNEVLCWGANYNGEIEVPTLVNPIDLSVGSQSNCVLDDEGVKCWGWGGNGETNVPELSNPKKIAAGEQTHCAIDDNGVTCWGWNGNDEASPPTGLDSPDSIAGGVWSSCAIQNGEVICWGGLSQYTVPNLDQPFDIGVGQHFACALDSTGLVCWGWNNDNLQQNLPFQPLQKPVALSIGNNNVCVLDDLGYQCWGNNDWGQSDVPKELTMDPDGDGVSNQGGLDAFPLNATESVDTDSDGTGNNADTDDDNDGVTDDEDSFPLDLAESIDTDADGTGNNADTDDDNDGVLDDDDAFPLDATEQADSDEDGVGDNSDVFPFDATESIDTDGDGAGDNADLDDDNDGYSDEQEAIDGTNPLNPFSCSQGCFSFDIDADEKLEAKALTDGLLVIRHLFGFTGDSLISGATSNLATRQEAEEITRYLNDAESELDIDGDGEAGALTDGLLLIRYLFGFSGDSLISGAVSENAQRTTAAQIEAYISERIPAI